MNDSDELSSTLREAVEQIRAVAAPPELAAQIIERAAAWNSERITAAMGRPTGPVRRRPPRWLYAAAVLFIIAGGLFGLGMFLHVGSGVAFAQVAQRFRDAHTLAFQQTIHTTRLKQAFPQASAPETVTMQIFHKGDVIRQEGPFGQVSVCYREQGKLKSLTLNPLSKTAVLLVWKGKKKESGTDPMKMVEDLRGLAGKDAQGVGRKRFGDVEAQGFRIKEGPIERLVWADPKTRLPIQVDFSLPDGTRLTLNEFRFNPRLDDSLFSIEVPKGYKLQAVELEDLTDEQNLVRMLRWYAGTAAGKFPKKLDDSLGLMMHLVQQGMKNKDKAGPESMRLGSNIVRAAMFVLSLKGDYGYRPDAAKLGDADKIIFWYRPTAASKSRALYGDMHWADLTTDQLPAKPR